MKTVNMSLERPVRIIPLNGETSLNIVSTGDYIISHTSTSDAPRVRAITLADTGKAVLSKSPMGANRTLKIILASEEASKEEFMRQVEMVWNKMQQKPGE